MFTWDNYLRWSNNAEYLSILGNWIHVSYTDLIWLTFFVYCFWSMIKTNSLRYKFIYFLFTIILLSFWGFWGSFDGMIYLMLLTELLVILLFLIVFLSYNFFTEEETPTTTTFYWFYLGAFLIYALSVPFAFGARFSYRDFVYLYTLDTMAVELYIFYFFLFVYYPMITIYIATVLGLFSLLFICIYFTLKRVQQVISAEKKSVVIIRKQNLVKQAILRSQMQTFQR